MKYIKILFGIGLVVVAFTVAIFTMMPLVTTEPTTAYKAIVEHLIKLDKLWILYVLPSICAVYVITSVCYAGLEMSAQSEQEKREKIKKLQEEFYEAISEEKYERCAEIRDEIKRLRE